MSSSRNSTLLKDVSHDHRLDLIRLDKKADVRRCVACTQGIIDSWYYNCPQVGCNYFLHKFCGELAVEIKHGFHQSHPLTLTTDLVEFEAFHRSCNACLEEFKGYFYSCEKCAFDLDLICATSTERLLEHPGHPHPLTLLQREIKTYCNCCGKKHEGIFYQCPKCVIFWLHEHCASFGTQAISPEHPHPLHFVFSDQSFYTNTECEICLQKITNWRSWYLECVPCRFSCHVHCALLEQKNEVFEQIESEIPRLPWEDCDGEFGVVGLLNRKTDEEVEIERMRISHFSHPEHELILQDEVPKEEDPYSADKLPLATKCNGCTRKISSPLYSCLDCDFFLHKSCAFLPTSIPQHHFHHKHGHQLVQSMKPWSGEEVFKCEFCMEKSNGFYFECEVKYCSYKVDVECAFLPTSILHKSHPFHLLTLSMNKGFKARCCDGNNMHQHVYECGKCISFWIHTSCAMYPGKASHRYDHENPFKLWYDRGAVEANYFYCERCEESMDPKAWYYHSKSSVGDQLMHPNCILQQEHPNFTKFKSTRHFLQVDIHPHHLHLSPSQPSDGSFGHRLNRYASQSCDDLCACCKNVFGGSKYSYVIYEGKGSEYSNEEDEDEGSEYNHEKNNDYILSYDCWEVDCKFRLHYSCTMKLQRRNLRRRNSTGAEEYPDESYP